MPTAPKEQPVRFTSWSFSRWTDYEQCPFRAMQVHLRKNRAPDRDVQARGTDIHALAYEWLKATRTPKLPAALQTFTEEFGDLRKAKPIIEQQWAFTATWSEADWFGATAWFRAMVDLHQPPTKQGLVQIQDLKSGKVYEEKGRLQLETYCLAALARYPDAKEVKAELWYLDQGKLLDLQMARAALAKKRQEWMARLRPMLNDRKFAPRPGQHCNWCHLSKTKGGPCKVA